MLPYSFKNGSCHTDRGLCNAKNRAYELNHSVSQMYIDMSRNIKSFLLVVFSCWVVSTSMQPHGPQQVRLLCPPLSARICSNSFPCYLNISSSVAFFSSFLHFFSASRSFPMSHLFASGVQNIGASALGDLLLFLLWLTFSRCSELPNQDTLQQNTIKKVVGSEEQINIAAGRMRNLFKARLLKKNE